jgi:hypothetical protein
VLEKNRLRRPYSQPWMIDPTPRITTLSRQRRGIVLASSILAAAVSALGQLVWENPIQEFERVPADESVEAQYAFKNAGSSPVMIVRVSSSCGCTVAQTDKKTYLPGESGQITARFTFGSRNGLQRKVITVGLSDGTEKQLGLNVSILEPLTVKPGLLLWRVGESATPKMVQLTAPKDVPVKIRSVTSSSPRVTTQLHVNTEASDYTLTVAPADTAEKLSTVVTIETDYPPDAPKRYPLHVRVK